MEIRKEGIKLFIAELLPKKLRHFFFGKSRIYCTCKHWRGWHVVHWESGIEIKECTSCDCKLFVPETENIIYSD